MDAPRGSAGNENLRLPIGKLIARAEGMDAARGENCPRAQGNKKQYAQTCFYKQDGVILPGWRLPVKICVAAILAKNQINSTSIRVPT
jgi:hypothetical protein